ncbi:hypothetical protein [Archangium sp.]|uniref:hypothetical protein n=1 Tax=Archangium sp. TaxID=1872627 RepID=UPI002D2E3200|nr:hypothetical protein [Archangium sp.]HYO54859.1 hypothetical protein [Archangium sp.]
MARFNFELGEEAASMLDALAQWTDRTRRADVIRDALAVYEALVRRARMGNRFFYGPDPKQLTELDIVSLSQARYKAEREAAAVPTAAVAIPGGGGLA